MNKSLVHELDDMHKEMELLQEERNGLHDQINQLNEEIGEERGQF